MEDHISKLPEDILVSILSQLKLREAARTSILSHGWRNMWKYTTGILDFDNPDLMYDMKYDNEQSCSLPTERDRFISWVNLVLELHQGSTLDEFRVCFDLDRRNDINTWIHFALKKRVKRLKLDFTSMSGLMGSNYILTRQILCTSNLDSLKALSLSFVEVTGDVLEYVLYSCPFLEVLHVEHSRSLVELKVPGSLPKLKRLEILSCNCMKYLEVLAGNLVSFSYHGPPIGLFFERVPCLVEASFGYIHSYILLRKIHQLSSYINQLESLALNLTCMVPEMYLIPLSEWMVRHGDVPLSMMDWGCQWYTKFPRLKKLEQLELNMWDSDVSRCVYWCTMLLKASPFLQRLVVKMKERVTHLNRSERKMKHLHRRLKLIEFVDFGGSMSDVEFVLDIAKFVRSLEKIILVPQPSRRHSETVEKVVECARLLKNSLPAGIQLIINHV